MNENSGMRALRHLRFVPLSRCPLVEEGGVAHRLLGVRSLLTPVLSERGLALVVALELEEAGGGVVAAVVAGGGRDLPLGPRGGAPVPAATPITSRYLNKR